MSSQDRRAAARRRAWGRGPVILRFEPLEGRQLLTVVGPDLLATQFTTVGTADWGDPVEATGIIANVGTAASPAPVEVDIYASSTPSLTTPGAVTTLLGSAVIPAGLAPGGSYKFDQVIDLPSLTPGQAEPKSQPLYLTLKVDPYGNIPEANTLDKQGRGLGADTSLLTIAPHAPANLAGTSFSVTPTSEVTPGIIAWGDSFNVVEQIKNTGQGNAPPTRARIVLTPAGDIQGGYNDVTLGTIAVPALPAFQSTNVVQAVTLPPVEPSALGNATAFTISVVQDGDFLTQPIYPKVADQGVGNDQGPIGIFPGPAAGLPVAALPDLAPASVVVSASSLLWGQQFQVGTVVQNVGAGPSGAFRVRFVAAGTSGDLTHGIFLGDVNVGGLAAGASVNVLAPASLPAKLPYGTDLANPAYAQIYAIVDPEDVVDQSQRGNNMASSAPVLLTAYAADGSIPSTVPTYAQNIYTSPALTAQAAKAAAKKTKLGVATPASTKPVKKHKVDLLASISESVIGNVEKQIKALPTNVNKLLKRIGVNGQSSGTTGTAATTTASQAAVTSAASTNAATAGSTGVASTTTSTSATSANGVTISSSGFGANNTSGGDGGFAASTANSTVTTT